MLSSVLVLVLMVAGDVVVDVNIDASGGDDDVVGAVVVVVLVVIVVVFVLLSRLQL